MIKNSINSAIVWFRRSESYNNVWYNSRRLILPIKWKRKCNWMFRCSLYKYLFLASDKISSLSSQEHWTLHWLCIQWKPMNGVESYWIIINSSIFWCFLYTRHKKGSQHLFTGDEKNRKGKGIHLICFASSFLYFVYGGDSNMRLSNVAKHPTASISRETLNVYNAVAAKANNHATEEMDSLVFFF